MARIDGSVAKRRTLRELARAVDEIGGRRYFSIEADGVEKAKGVISLIHRGWIFHAYFSEDTIQFELITDRPLEAPPGILGPGESLTGLMSPATLKKLLPLFEKGASPLTLIASESLEVRVCRID